ncbi:Septum formation [Amycolatopsis arida]|uniref:Septum formation n=1 Tax=Amycolatopsis arida TaxID=587909 RepID=A0A1I5TCB5_9PSEU|nr:septum formation family protein [Amycolatopsis arida]TDX96146.1 putative regulator of septum formation [Amycolatopsis arida]SFP80693.1 Septum formation [Amycolatopsis arida]
MGRRKGFTLVAAAVLTVTGTSACTTEVPGTAVPGAAPPSTASRPTGQAGPDPRPAPGQCVTPPRNTTVLDCAQPHTVEIVKAGMLDADVRKERVEIFRAVLPECRAEVGSYLGNTGYDATTLGAWLLWAGEEDWQRGDRWYRCGVAQLDADGEPESRTGSVQGALAGAGLYDFQLCSAELPSRSRVRQVPCDGPHVGEAIGVVPMGQPSDPVPTREAFEAEARPRCTEMVHTYLGAQRDDVFASWRWPDESSWREGFTNVVCYAETAEPVTRPLRGIGDAPLPR